MPYSIAEASLTGKPGRDDMDLPQAWSYLLQRLGGAAQIVESDPVSRNRVDLAAGMRHLLVLLAAGVDEALRFDPDPILSVDRTSTDDVMTWGMECPDCIYTRATMRGGESYRLFGNRGTARYVGLQTMNGIVSTANELVDELDVDDDGNFEVVLSADEREGNWMRIDGEHPTLTVRHFFYDWDTEVPSSLQIERLGDPVEAETAHVDPDVAVSRQLVALGDFVHDNLQFFLQFGGAAPSNGFLPPIDRTAMGAAAENKPVIGRWELGPDEALILEVEPPVGRLLELLARQPVVGDDPLRTPPVQPECPSGRGGFRRAGAGGAVRTRSRCRELAGHRGPQQRRDDPALRAHRRRHRHRRRGWCRSTTSRRRCLLTPATVTPAETGIWCWNDAGAPCTKGSR